MRSTVTIALLVATLLPAIRISAQAPDRRAVEFFEKKIRPVLVKSCYECHSASAKELGGKLRLDHRDGLLKGGETGPAVVPKKPGASLLIQAIEYRDDLEMPPDGKLPARVIADFRTWIKQGAVDPRKKPAVKPSAGNARPAPSRDLWSLKPVVRPGLPEVSDGRWPRDDIDRFVLARLESEGFSPAGDATPETLLRRVHFDLVGLPPTPEDLAAFRADHSDKALAAVVDRLLASPRFGERWARHWLDVVRYAESAGSSRDVLMLWAWRYRDYVIDAINADVRFDRFLAEQLAGDLLDAASPEDARRLRIATGFLAIGQKSLNGGNIPLDIIDDQLDVIGKSILGLAIGCARCHDHKFDPIPTADYYAMAGIFRSTETLYGGGIGRPKTIDAKLKVYLVLGDASAADEWREVQKKLAGLKKQRGKLAKRKAKLGKQLPNGKPGNPDAAPTGKKKKLLSQFKTVGKRLASLDEQIEQLKKSLEQLPPLDFGVGVRESKKIGDGRIQVRGEKDKAGPVVPRGFLAAVPVADLPTITGQQSGRLELAHWLTRPDNPLTPRVAVNRFWQHVFGQGLVATVDNFGHNGRSPSHPELLDWLAHRFVHHHKWSRKAMVRELVLTRVYRLASTYDERAYQADPAARLFWRRNRRRLEAEAIRDAMLAVSGRLDTARPEASPVTRIGEGEVGRNINTSPLFSPFPYRSVYLPIVRGIVPEFLKLFDFPDPSNPQGVRDETNVPAQSLYLMNSRFVFEQADGLAERLLGGSGDDPARVTRAYRIALSRDPTPGERARSLEYIETTTARLGETAGKDGDSGGDQKASPRQRAWSLFSQVLLAGAEFRYLD